MPANIAEDDFSRLESLCMLFGVGLALFDIDPNAPNYRIRVRAQRFSPDMFYVNELADRLRMQDPATFEKLFRACFENGNGSIISKVLMLYNIGCMP